MPLSVDTQFSSLMDDMASFSDTIDKYLRGTDVQREWMIPSAAGFTFNPTDIANLGTPFDRSSINTEYSNEYTGSGGSTDEIRAVMGTHVEISYMCMMERAFRARHRLCARSLMHVAGRRKAHGDAVNGVHKAAVQGYVQELFNS